MTESSAYIEANCKTCKSRGYLGPDGVWVHAWGSRECAERPVFEPDFRFDGS